jgi:hypothetical protein
MTTKKTKYSVVLDDGSVATRSSARGYTHAVVVETTPAEKAADIAKAESRLAKTKAEVARRAPRASTPEAKAEYGALLALDAYWHEKVAGRDGALTERWLTLSQYAHDFKNQGEVDAHYARLREHLAHIPAGLDNDGRDIQALVLSTPALLGLKVEENDFRNGWRQRRVYVSGINLTGVVSHLRYAHVVYKLEAAREEQTAAEKALITAREQPTGAASQSVYGWAGSPYLAQGRVAAERAKRPLARVFSREATVKK